ncbi:hypothetical protein ACFRJ3_29765 [Streptomyces sp. NPDC056696]|uniref:hypothetical protein n=1 Tax=Streptomyces sp. NPDC056696 TaxID=3345914 RepID=UPI0036B47577
MATEYGKPLRGVRKEHCDDCRTSTEMLHLRFEDDAETDVRRCSDCGTEARFEALITAPPGEATMHDVW